nr:starch-binding protein [Ruminococcus sp.]
LKKNDELKVVETNGSIQGFEPKWYPDGNDNNYVVAADGTYDIYFRPAANGGEDWWYGCIYLADVTPEPTEATQATTEATQATEATEATAPATKVTILYSDVHGWDKVYVHAWTADNKDLTTWPGVEMTKGEKNEYNQYQYTAELDATVSGMVFNNGAGAQDPNAAYNAEAIGYYYDADSNTVKTWTAADVLEGEIAAPIAKAADDTFGTIANFKGLEMLGIQEKTDASDIRFVTAISKNILNDKNVVDYGYVVTKSSKSKAEAEAALPNLTPAVAKFSCKGTTCAAAGDYGDGSKDYSYVTFGVNNIPAGKCVLARFYVETKLGTTYYYATYDGDKPGIVYTVA